MTDKEKIEAIKDEIECRIDTDCYNDNPREELESLLELIDSLQEEPQVKESAEVQHVNETCKGNGNSLTQEPVSENFKIALEKKVREAQDWTYIEEEGGECPLNVEFGAYDLEEFARWGANWKEQQLMKESTDVKIGFWDGELNFDYGQNQMHDYLKSKGLTGGDKVKLIVIKK